MKREFFAVALAVILSSCNGVPEKPARRSIDWCQLKAQWEGNDKDYREVLSNNGYVIREPNWYDIKTIFSVYITLAPHAGSENWSALNMAVMGLAQKEKFDRRVIPIIHRRYLDVTLENYIAGIVLDDYQSKGREDLFLKRAKAILDAQERGQPVATSYQEWSFFMVMLNGSKEWPKLMARAGKLSNNSSHEVWKMHVGSKKQN